MSTFHRSLLFVYPFHRIHFDSGCACRPPRLPIRPIRPIRRRNDSRRGSLTIPTRTSPLSFSPASRQFSTFHLASWLAHLLFCIITDCLSFSPTLASCLSLLVRLSPVTTTCIYQPVPSKRANTLHNTPHSFRSDKIRQPRRRNMSRAHNLTIPINKDAAIPSGPNTPVFDLVSHPPLLTQRLRTPPHCEVGRSRGTRARRTA